MPPPKPISLIDHYENINPTEATQVAMTDPSPAPIATMPAVTSLLVGADYPFSNASSNAGLSPSDDILFVLENASPPGTLPSSSAMQPGSGALNSPVSIYTAQTSEEVLNLMMQNCSRSDENKTWFFSQHNFITDLSPAAMSQLDQPIQTTFVCNAEWGNKPIAIVLHYTGGLTDSALAEWRYQENRSIHYLVTKEGKVIQTLPEDLMAYHVSCYSDLSNCVASCPICTTNMGELIEPYTQSIGIEIENWGPVDPEEYPNPVYEDFTLSYGRRYWDDFTPEQIDALRILIRDIQSRWGISDEMVFGHYRINKKNDPGPALNITWDRNGSPPREALLPEGNPQ